MFHECHGRSHCSHFEVLKYIPKRKEQWCYGLPGESREAWGLEIVFGLSLVRITMYHAIIVSGPAVFWGLWLRQWPTDWQNASVPFFTIVALLSLLWLPISESAKAKSELQASNKDKDV